MTDKRDMTPEHLDDPLDYLYEELPADRQAEAKHHLAACPVCREEMKKVREAVKTYRSASRPVPPAGLAARAAAEALRQANHFPETAEPVLALAAEIAVPEETTDSDKEFARLKEEVLSEIKRSRWRDWLFHPVWTLAAMVVFICSVLVHLGQTPPPSLAPLSQSQERARQTSLPREKLPPPQARQPRRQTSPAPTSPTLSEAEAWQEDLAPEPAPMPAQRKAAAAMERSAAASAPLSPVAPPPPAPSIGDFSPAPTPPRVHVRPPMEASSESAAAAAEEAPAFFDGGLPPPAADSMTLSGDTSFSVQTPSLPSYAPLPSMAIPAQTPAGSATVSPPASATISTAKEAAGPSAPPALTGALALPLPDIPVMGWNWAAEEAAETSDQAEWRDLEAAATMSMNELPRLVERPSPIDTEKLALDLATQAGINIGSGDWELAREAVALLRKYDPQKAAELAALIDTLSQTMTSAEAETPVQQAEIASEAKADASDAASGSVVDKYFPAAGYGSTTTAATPVPPTEKAETGVLQSVLPPAVADVPPPMAASPLEPGESDQTAMPPAEPYIPAAPAEDLPAVEAHPDASIQEEPGPLGLNPIIPEGLVVVSVPYDESLSLQEDIPAAGDVFPMQPANVSDVLKAKADAVPPTLWESGGGSRRGGVDRERNETGQRRIFSTDPYVRDR